MRILPGKITIHDIEEALKLEHPGDKIHQKMLPEGRSLLIPTEKKENVKESAVLVFLFIKTDELHICLTRRNQNMKYHPGQISFPGGRREEKETSNVETALREFEEETGVYKTEVRVIGKLSDLYISVSNFIIHPIVGYLDHEPEFTIDPREVEELINIPLQPFFDENNITHINVETNIGLLNVPCYKIDKEHIWGATAMIIAEFTALLSEFFRLKAEFLNNGDNGLKRL